jgi:hypothetical protein
MLDMGGSPQMLVDFIKQNDNCRLNELDQHLYEEYLIRNRYITHESDSEIFGLKEQIHKNDLDTAVNTAFIIISDGNGSDWATIL